MRLTVDGTPLLLRSAGVKTYMYHWIRSLREALGPQDRLRVFPMLESAGALDHNASMLSGLSTWSRLALVQAINMTGSTLLDTFVAGSDLFHCSNMIRVAPKRVRLSATIYDMTTFLMPEFHTEGNIRADRYYSEQILKKAERLIAISEHSKQDAIKVLGLSPDKIHTVHPGVPAEYFDAKPTPRVRPYVLFVSTIEPRKNVPVLLDAWKLLHADLRERFDLVVAGPPGWQNPETVERVKQESVYLGYVPEHDMPGLFAGATVLAYPSLYEGFGLPVAQAMAARVPVVTSNVSCLPEVAGDGALYTDPHSPAELATQLARLLESESLRANVATAGRKKAEQYRWQTCAAHSIAALNVAG